MTEGTDQPLKGHCLCGAVQITVTAFHKEIDICHCRMCQRWGGAFYAGLESDAFEIEGEDRISVYKSSDWAERAFCSKCGSNLWYKFLPTGNRTFLAGLFDVPEGMPIKHQIFVDEKPDWYDLAQESPMKTGPEIIAEAEAVGFTFD
ncbi:GFA family protein [Erythrobacter sp. THAF29]|uniref:GFA family protein n=1 Tax=Erythrobacter sp. THAF29 TaxID=2587851 RepID=UPI00126911E0|nr:GFA family protein [Erythrobacter sp. THAF29]QFT77372.1 Glutathione-dependent formaldehyde-activating enzyme [Erythrobacter sp. THAF29]